MLPLLRTRTTIPPIRPKQIDRVQLIERIQNGSHRALTLILAPAGFGKTTLAAAWARECGKPVAWLSLQPSDLQGNRFLAYLVQALQTISPQLGQTSLAMLHGGSPEGALFALVNDLAEIEEDFYLILDDYHSVDNPETASIVQFLLENRQAFFHIVLVSRTEPSLTLTRLRANDQITEIYAADLRFTAQEVQSFLETCMDVHLPPEEIARLDQSTEGWAVGLQLAALALSQRPANWQTVAPLAGQEHIFNYLAEEVLHHEPPEVQDFLIKTAIFDRFCIPLCEQVIYPHAEGQQKTVKEILASIERANLFLFPLDSTWYRYHALFTDFLRRLAPPDQNQALYREASAWFEKNNLLDDAIHYATHAADYERAANMLESNYLDILQRGGQAALAEWIAAIPPELLDQRPRLWLAKAWANVILLDMQQAEICVKKAESLFPTGESGDRLRGEAKALRILSGIFTGNLASANDISSAFILLSEEDDFLHSMLHFNLGMRAVTLGETSMAVESFAETLRLSSTLNNPLVSIVAQGQLGEIRQMRGALGLAERAFQQAIQYTKDTLGEHTFLLGMPYVSYANLLREQNRFEEAVHYAEQGIAYCQVWQPVASMDGYITLARILAAQGKWERSRAHFETALKLVKDSPSLLDDTIAALFLARQALIQGDLIQANQVINRYNLENVTEKMFYMVREMAQLVLLRARIAGLDGNKAQDSTVAALTELIADFERRERVSSLLEALILRAYALHAANRHADVLEDLSHALSLGAQSGYIRMFADEGKPLFHLLEQYHTQIHAPHSYLDQICQILRREISRAIPPLDMRAAETPSYESLTPLTRRELDILILLAAGKSNQEIAEERVLALNTVKKHVANILSKLGVANRTQAVLLAKKLGWIE